MTLPAVQGADPMTLNFNTTESDTPLIVDIDATPHDTEISRSAIGTSNTIPMVSPFPSLGHQVADFDPLPINEKKNKCV